MGIEFHFCEFFKNFPLNETTELNEKCVKKAINAFPKNEKNILLDQNILVFFNDRISIQYPDQLGAMTRKDSLNYKDFLKKYDYEIKKISNFSVFEYIVYLSKKIAENDNEIFKSLTIIHELQHVLQDINFKCIFTKINIVGKYLELKGKWSNEIYRNMPHEVDAYIKAKRISYRLFDKKDVDNYIDDKINEYETKISNTRKNSSGFEELRIEKSYWENIKSIDINKPYDLEGETECIWNKYKEQLEKEIDRIEMKKEEDLEDNEKNFLNAYEFHKEKYK